MEVSLESRVPFLGRELIEFAVPANALSKELRAKNLYAGVLKNEWPKLYSF